MVGPRMHRGGTVSGRQAQTGFAVVGLTVVALYACSLAYLLLFSGGHDAFGGGQGRGDRESSTFFNSTSLVLMTLGYLAVLSVWAGLRGKWVFLARHAVTAAAMWLLVLLYLNAFGSFEFHRRDWNRVFAHVSVVLFAVTLSIGPLARLWRPAVHALAWRRETGVWATLAALVHVAVYWEGTYGWAGWRLFFYPGDREQGVIDTLMGGGTFHLANVVGLLALAYAVVLTAVSNDAGQRWLRSGWGWLMDRATTMWLLVLLHVWAFAYYVQGMGLVRLGTLWVSFFAVLLLQSTAFARTVWVQHRKMGVDDHPRE